MESEQVVIRGATGVDLKLSIAGPGSRSYAFLIDWHIRLLVALAWLVAGMLIVNGALTLRPAGAKAGGPALLLVVLPALAIYFLYHPVIELMLRGQTPGKRIAGVRVVTREGGIPGIGAILIRNVFRIVDSLPTLYVAGLVTTFLSAQRVRIGDMAAGTLLVVDTRAAMDAFGAATAAAAAAGATDLATADIAAQILERWPDLDSAKRSAIARALLSRGLGADAAARLGALDDDGLRAALRACAGGGSA